MSNNTFPFRFRVYNITSTIYTITCSVCILIGCWPWSIKGHTHRWHQISSAPKIFNKPIEFLSCKTNRLHFSVCVYCNRSQKTSQRVKNNSHATRLRLVLFCSLHAVTWKEWIDHRIYYITPHRNIRQYYLIILCTHTRKNVISLLNTVEPQL